MRVWPSRPTPHAPGTLDVRVMICSETEASVALVGELDVAHARDAARMLRMLVNRGYDATVDASALSFIDATGLAALLSARALARARRRTLVIVSPSEPVARMIELTATQDLLHACHAEEPFPFERVR